MLERIEWFLQGALHVIGGLCISLIAYLAEIRGDFYLMWICMFFDLGFGLLKSKLVDKQPFKMAKFLLWLLFVLASTAVVGLVFAIERQHLGIEPIAYRGFALIITGFVLFSIVRNVEKMTKKYIFTIILDMLNSFFKRVTNVDLKKYEKENNKRNNV